jgi:hypothetical protein
MKFIKKNKLILIFFTLLLTYYCSNYYKIKIDGLKNELFGVITYTQTDYSNNYTHEKFLKIKIGMNLNEVIKLIGEPINSTKNKEELLLVYSNSKADTHYRKRIIILRDKKVVKIITGVYID